MNFRLLIVLGAGSWLGLTGCSTNETSHFGTGRPYTPLVSMPTDLNRDEQALLPEVEEVLERNGLRPTGGGGAEYALEFSVEDGPVNADVTLDLFRGREKIARSFARVGGARIIWQRKRVIREAFENAIADFERQLPRVGGRGYGDAGGGSAPGRPSPVEDGRSGYPGNGADMGDDRGVDRGTPYEDRR